MIVKLSALGDVVCGTAAATAIKQADPSGEIVWMVDKRFRGIVDCCRSVDQVVVAEKRPRALYDQVKNLGAFDYAFDLQGLLKSSLPVHWATANKKFGYHWQREGARFLIPQVVPDKDSIHIVDQLVDCVRASGLPVSDGPASFDLAAWPEDVEKMLGVLCEAGRRVGRPLVLMNAGAGWATKRWSPENFAALTNTLHQHDIDVAYLGTEADRSAFEEVAMRCASRPIDLLGKSSVRELVALVGMADLHVAGDTGSTHLAAALGRPCIGLYTLTRPERCCPYGQITTSRSIDREDVIKQALEILGVTSPLSVG